MYHCVVCTEPKKKIFRTDSDFFGEGQSETLSEIKPPLRKRVTSRTACLTRCMQNEVLTLRSEGASECLKFWWGRRRDRIIQR